MYQKYSKKDLDNSLTKETRFMPFEMTVTEAKNNIDFLLSAEVSPKRESLMMRAVVNQVLNGSWVINRIDCLIKKTGKSIAICAATDDGSTRYPIVTARSKAVKVYKTLDYLAGDLMEISGKSMPVEIIDLISGERLLFLDDYEVNPELYEPPERPEW
jgi:hypothetical protein